jgi:hypothetical protein
MCSLPIIPVLNNCSDTGDCGDYSARIPGLYAVPMTTLLDPKTDEEFASMDPATASSDELMALLQYNFKVHYAARIPWGLWLHAAWFMTGADRDVTLNKFLEWTKTYTNNNVWFVTAAQLIGIFFLIS